MDGQDRRFEAGERLDGFFYRVRDIVQLEVEEDRHLALGDAQDALVPVGAEKLEPELHSAATPRTSRVSAAAR